MEKVKWCHYEVNPLPINDRGKNREVYEAFDPAKNRKVAIKRFSSRKKACREYKIMKRCRENIYMPSCYELFTLNGKHHMVMEFVDGCELKVFLIKQGKLKKTKAIEMFFSIIDAVKGIHALGLYHNDLDSRNIMIDSRHNIKIIDMGRASKKRNEAKEDLYQAVRNGFKLLNKVGSFNHLPEQIKAIVAKGNNPDPQQRYKTADEILLDLKNAGYTRNTPVYLPDPSD